MAVLGQYEIPEKSAYVFSAATLGLACGDERTDATEIRIEQSSEFVIILSFILVHNSDERGSFLY
jgi:hypothetical protein